MDLPVGLGTNLREEHLVFESNFMGLPVESSIRQLQVQTLEEVGQLEGKNRRISLPKGF